MKTLLLCLIMSEAVFANDFIYSQGFENTALVSGTVLGLSSDGLSLELSTTIGTETLEVVDTHIGIVFSLPVTIGDQWQVTLKSLPSHPNQQSCILSNASGEMTSSGVNNLVVECSIQQWKWDEMQWNEGGWQ